MKRQSSMAATTIAACVGVLMLAGTSANAVSGYDAAGAAYSAANSAVQSAVRSARDDAARRVAQQQAEERRAYKQRQYR